MSRDWWYTFGPMKKTPLLFTIFFTFIAALSAQTMITPNIPPISSFPMFQTQDNPPVTDNQQVLPAPVINYPIGTITQPVVAGEYCTFLTDTLAPQNESSLEALKEKFGIIEGGPIACDGFFNNYNFYWDLNRTSEIISTVPSAEVQKLFNQWRSNPTSQELLDYIIDVYHTESLIGSKVSRNHTAFAPTNILSLYPNSTTLSKAKGIGLYPVGGDYLLFNERGVPVTTAIINKNHALNPKNFLGTNRYLVPQPDYHRPIDIRKI